MLATALLALMAAAGAPSPLYVVYQQRWGFSATVLTFVFAVYALALLVALLTVGALSDHVGRRPVLLIALTAQAAAMVLFLIADGPHGLLLARAAQGLATGAATGAISAGLVDLQPPSAKNLGAVLNSAGTPSGVALGGVTSGLVLQYVPAPTTVVFAAFAGVFLLLAVAVAWLPETSPRRPGALASLLPRAAVPSEARGAFLRVAPAATAGWALVGLYLSLGPSLAREVLGIDSGLAGGLVVAALTGTGALVGTPLRGMAPRKLMIGGPTALAAGTLLVALALAGHPSTALFFAGTLVAGAGFGTGFLGAFGTLAAVPTSRRAELFSSFYIISYLALSIPAVLAGILAPARGLHFVAEGYAGAVVLLALAAAGLSAAGRRAYRAVVAVETEQT